VKIAVTYENGNVGQHFGKTEQFKLYETEGGKIVSSAVVGTNGAGHGALAGFLKDAGADVLICGGIGMGARMALAETGIELLPGVEGPADEVVAQYLAGSLAFDPEATCHHHDGDHGHDHADGHACGSHGGSCGSHGCH